jgi:glycosyltransferase involved in cell wall biosynthesis
MRVSGAVQLRDLTREFSRQGHSITVIVPEHNQTQPWKLESMGATQVLRLKSPKLKNIGNKRRAFAELIMPFCMMRNFKKSPFSTYRWDGLIWYSPSIFHGPLISKLKKLSGCKAYLIIRDIFPEWAVEMGLMRRGLAYKFFNAIAQYQYSLADVIGIQSSGNQKYFDLWTKRPGCKLEVLENWLESPIKLRSPIRVEETLLAGRRLFVYAGNMGLAQAPDIFIGLAKRLHSRKDVGFLFVGRGSSLDSLKSLVRAYHLDNVVFFDEIDPDEISDLYDQCEIGMVALSGKHKSHNIPGKFISYMQNGLPVLAKINSGNDLAEMIRENKVGEVCETEDLDELEKLARKMLDEIDARPGMAVNCKLLFEERFNVKNTVQKIVVGLSL